jgi:hypothetical protein
VTLCCPSWHDFVGMSLYPVGYLLGVKMGMGMAALVVDHQWIVSQLRDSEQKG